jgi:hypothetical protein
VGKSMVPEGVTVVSPVVGEEKCIGVSSGGE